MSFFLKLAAANAVIVAATRLGKAHPPLAGLIATMPLTTVLVMVWLRSEAPGDDHLMIGYTRGVLWGILPSLAFFVAALLCFRRHLPFSLVLAVSFATWLAGAFLHRWFVAQ